MNYFPYPSLFLLLSLLLPPAVGCTAIPPPLSLSLSPGGGGNIRSSVGKCCDLGGSGFVRREIETSIARRRWRGPVNSRLTTSDIHHRLHNLRQSSSRFCALLSCQPTHPTFHQQQQNHQVYFFLFVVSLSVLLLHPDRYSSCKPTFVFLSQTDESRRLELAKEV